MYAKVEGEGAMLSEHFEALTKVSLTVESERDALKAELKMLKTRLGEVTSSSDTKLQELLQAKGEISRIAK